MQGNTETSSTQAQLSSTSAESFSYADILSNPSIISTLSARGQSTPTPLHKHAIPAILSGSDVRVVSPTLAGSYLLIGLCIAELQAKDDAPHTTLVVGELGSADRTELRDLGELGLDIAIVEGSDTSDDLSSGSIISGSASDLTKLVINEKIEASTIRHVVVLSRKQLDSDGEQSLATLLAAIDNTCQRIWIGEHEPTPGISKYFRSPKLVTPDGLAKTIPVTHTYYEIGSELLAKPNALAQIIELSGFAPTVIFCNTPSDTDFVHVMLRKRGISSKKLIGHLPQFKVAKLVRELMNREVVALVVTDIGARGVEVEDIPLIINHSIHSDPEVYLHRAGHAELSAVPRSVVSVVSPMDIASFHYLRKILHLDFKKMEPPSEEEVLMQKLAALREKALDFSKTCPSGLTKLAQAVIADEKSLELVAYFINCTMNPPAARSAPAESGSDYDEGDDFRDDYQRGDNRHRSRGGDRQRGGQRGERHDRRRGDDYNSRERHDDDSSGDSQQERFASSNGDRYSRGHERRNDYRDRRDAPPAQREVRVYLGCGTRQGVTEDSLMQHVKTCAGLDDAAVRRVTLRGSYSFVDFPEEIAEEALSKLDGSEVAGGEKLVARKATILTVGGRVTSDDQREEASAADDDRRPDEEQQAHDVSEGTDGAADDSPNEDEAEGY